MSAPVVYPAKLAPRVGVGGSHLSHRQRLLATAPLAGRDRGDSTKIVEASLLPFQFASVAATGFRRQRRMP